MLVRRVEESYGFLKRKRGSFLSLRRTRYYGYKSLSGVSWEGHVQDIPLYLRKIEEALGDLEEQSVTGLNSFTRNVGKRVEDMQSIYKAGGTEPTL